MTLAEYIAGLGDAEFARRFAITERSARAYRLQERFPKKELARQIVEQTVVTWAGIYAAPDRAGRTKVAA